MVRGTRVARSPELERQCWLVRRRPSAEPTRTIGKSFPEWNFPSAQSEVPMTTMWSSKVPSPSGIAARAATCCSNASMQKTVHSWTRG